VFIASHTRMMVKRAAAGAEGFVLDHYDRAAIATHLHAVGDRLAQAFGTNPPYAVFSDSLEVERSDWTTNFPDEFRKRRGYDLLPHLPALASDSVKDSAAIRHDWGRTLSELADDNYLTPIREWAHQHGTLFPLPKLRHAAGFALEQRAGRSPGRRRDAVAPLFRHALGCFRQSSLRPAHHFIGNLDLDSLTRLSRDSARPQGRSRPSFHPGRQPVSRTRLALFAGLRR
jgi:hypothetical protein